MQNKASLPQPKDDLVIDAFLEFLAQDMIAHPHRIQLLDPKRLEEVASLTQGIRVDPHEDLSVELDALTF